jgi:hypothetical protein
MIPEPIPRRTGFPAVCERAAMPVPFRVSFRDPVHTYMLTLGVMRRQFTEEAARPENLAGQDDELSPGGLERPWTGDTAQALQPLRSWHRLTDEAQSQAAVKAEVQCGQRVALSGTTDRQYGQSLVAATVASCSFLRRFTWRISMNTTKATIRKSKRVFRNTP